MVAGWVCDREAMQSDAGDDCHYKLYRDLRNRLLSNCPRTAREDFVMPPPSVHRSRYNCHVDEVFL